MKTVGLLNIIFVVYSITQSTALWAFWMYTPFDPYSWLALAAWVSPVLYYLKDLPQVSASSTNSPRLLFLAMIIMLGGSLGSVNALRYLALAMGIVSLMPWHGLYSFIWLLGSFSWMPVLGWALLPYLPFTMLVPRLCLAACSVGLYMKQFVSIEVIHEQ